MDQKNATLAKNLPHCGVIAKKNDLETNQNLAMFVFYLLTNLNSVLWANFRLTLSDKRIYQVEVAPIICNKTILSRNKTQTLP